MVTINPVYQANVNQKNINKIILQTASTENKAEFKASLDGSVQSIFKDASLTPEQKSSQALAIQQQRTLNLLT